MKNKTNNKLLVLTTLAAISLNGCASKKITVIEPTVDKVIVPQIQQVDEENQRFSQWKGIKNSKKEDCVNCYANIVKEPVERVASVKNSTTVYGYDYAETSDMKAQVEEYENPYLEDNEVEEVYEEGNSYLVDASYSEENDIYSNESNNLYANVKMHVPTEKNNKLLAKNSIQVGAFRKYAGAKVYAKRYSLLTSKYNVDIKENIKDNQPIYRVQIEGFSNENEAKEFMDRYGLDGAFLVRR